MGKLYTSASVLSIALFGVFSIKSCGDCRIDGVWKMVYNNDCEVNTVEISRYISENKELLLQTLRELCAIPAPSHHEEARAAYCRNWLVSIGAKDVYIDEANNVIYPLGCEDSKEIVVLAAHTDTVFPDTEPLPYEEGDEVIRCPGVCDDTAAVAVLLLTVKFFVEQHIVPKKGLLFVLDSGEEGLGDLKGVRRLFRDYEGRIVSFVSFDGTLRYLNDDCAGSHRYKVTVRTQGGHSFQDFGRPNAIVKLAEIISELEKFEMPTKTGTRTTRNIGTIEGGTSVNTIAQSASMVCEYRSTHRECLDYMKEQFDRVFAEARSDGVEIEVTMVGNRPCSHIDEVKQTAFRDRLLPMLREIVGGEIVVKSASTDCNIPLSLGIPALCVGAYEGDGMHTREEWLDKSSMSVGLEVAIKVALNLMEG